jgi:hypothetical protein
MDNECENDCEFQWDDNIKEAKLESYIENASQRMSNENQSIMIKQWK